MKKMMKSVQIAGDNLQEVRKDEKRWLVAVILVLLVIMAELASVTLGKPTFISESIQIPPVVRDVYTREAIPAVETQISPGEMEISLTVQVAYAFLK